MLLNCTNHPYEIWNKPQREAAAAYGDVVDLPFPAVDPHASPEELRRLVREYGRRIMALHPDTVLAAGEFTFLFMLVDLLLRNRIPVICTCSGRMTRETKNPDGSNSKEVLFVFEGFREYRYYGED